jgi:heme/copper-type cytochrome/quinol oxidase subunit 2
MLCPKCGNDIPVETYHDETQHESVYSVLQWFGTFLLMFIPVVNIVLLFIWIFSKKVNRNKRNWALASLFIFVIIIILLIIMYAVFVAYFNKLFGN